ncbi:MAG TPA: sulfatase-like hydrolase/transferase, partial [Saprospiraceae bacterium]
GQYTHHHKVIDNQSPVPEEARFFPEYLQKAGYHTAFFGKWHMGNDDSAPQKGFDHWVSFKGQGVYYNPTLNINGTETVYKDSSYITDLLTTQTLEFLDHRKEKKPFFIYLSHKAVHAEFMPPKRHKGVYDDIKVNYPPSMFPPNDPQHEGSPYNYAELPDWVKAQRYSWHGVDYMYHGAIKFESFYQQYCETLLGVDESIQSILDYLEQEGLLENTIVIYMGDNGFSFGEHGLIDKRHAYEESMRVPLLVFGKGITPGIKIEQLIQNIDIAPMILEMANAKKVEDMDGESFTSLLHGESKPWRDTIYYEYFWERAFPQTPTIFAVRTSQYKFIRNHGIWDINELYDLQADPNEMNNLIRSPKHQDMVKIFDESLFRWLENTGGMSMPLRKDEGKKFDHRYNNTW